MELVEVSCFYVSYCNWNSVVICLGIWISAIMSVTSNHQFILTNLRIFFNKISCSDLFNDAAKCKSALFSINVLSISYVDLARTKLESRGYTNSTNAWKLLLESVMKPSYKKASEIFNIQISSLPSLLMRCRGDKKDQIPFQYAVEMFVYFSLQLCLYDLTTTNS